MAKWIDQPYTTDPRVHNPTVDKPSNEMSNKELTKPKSKDHDDDTKNNKEEEEKEEETQGDDNKKTLTLMLARCYWVCYQIFTFI